MAIAGLSLIVIMFAMLWLTNFYLGLGIGGKNKEAGILAMWFYAIVVGSYFRFDNFFVSTATITTIIVFVVLFIAFFAALPFGSGCFLGEIMEKRKQNFCPV